MKLAILVARGSVGERDDRVRVVRSEDGGGESAWGEGAGDSGARGKDGGPLQPQPGTTATTTCPPTGLTANAAPTPQQTLLTLTTLMTARTHMHIRHRSPDTQAARQFHGVSRNVMLAHPCGSACHHSLGKPPWKRTV